MKNILHLAICFTALLTLNSCNEDKVETITIEIKEPKQKKIEIGGDTPEFKKLQEELRNSKY